jgi:hypothetical protein
MTDEMKQGAAAWRARMVAAMNSLDTEATVMQYGDRLGDAAEALAELDSVRTICRWAEHYASETANIIEHNQRKEIRTLEVMLAALADKDLDHEGVPQMERMRFVADLVERLAKMRADAVHAGIAFAVQLLAETRAYFAQIAAGSGGPNADVMSILVHACMVGEMRKIVAEEQDADPDADVRPQVAAFLDELAHHTSEVKS